MCGVFGVYGVEKPVEILCDMMGSSQYRGEQGAGVALLKNDGEFFFEREAGLVPNLMQKIGEDVKRRQFLAGIGHLRYGTSGSRFSLKNVQPLYAKIGETDIYLAHNGDTPNHEFTRAELIGQGAIFTTDSDTEFVLHLIGFSEGKDIVSKIIEALAEYRGTFSITMLVKDENGVKLIAARDPWGNRPLALGKIGDGFVVASEDSAFEVVGADFLREIKPGELLVISENGIEEYTLKGLAPRGGLCQCVYEGVYFSFPTSNIFGFSVSAFREELGRLAERRFGHLVRPGDVIINIPDSSNSFLDGFCKSLGVYPERAIVRRHSMRSFTQDNQAKRDEAVRKKHSRDTRRIVGKRVWVLDDSVVRGTTSRKINRMLRAGGAEWIGYILSCPPIIGHCRKGIDFSENLIAAQNLTDEGLPDIERVKEFIEADFLGYLDLSDLKSAVRNMGLVPENFCYGCFENREPIWNMW